MRNSAEFGIAWYKTRVRPVIPFGLALLVLLAGACGAPPGLRSSGNQVPVPSPAETATPRFPPGYTPEPTASPSRSVSPSPSLSPFSEFVTVPCGPRVTAEQVISLVRDRTDIRPSRAVNGPLCAGTWQFTELQVPDRDPVQAVTMTSNGLKLVAVGTEVCTAEVQLQAPSAIRTAAGC
jgi:hypothetical protein